MVSFFETKDALRGHRVNDTITWRAASAFCVNLCACSSRTYFGTESQQLLAAFALWRQVNGELNLVFISFRTLRLSVPFCLPERMFHDFSGYMYNIYLFPFRLPGSIMYWDLQEYFRSIKQEVVFAECCMKTVCICRRVCVCVCVTPAPISFVLVPILTKTISDQQLEELFSQWYINACYSPVLSSVPDKPFGFCGR